MSRFRNVMITLWNEPKPDIEQVRYYVYQVEKCPRTQKKHYQMYCEFYDKKSVKQIKQIFNDTTMHIEPRYGSQEDAIKYCSKEESRLEGPFFFGKKGNQGHRSDLDSMVDMIESGATGKEILIEMRGNALRHINHIYKGLYAFWDLEPVDSLILFNRERLSNAESDEHCPEVNGNTGHSLPKWAKKYSHYENMRDSLIEQKEKEIRKIPLCSCGDKECGICCNIA